MSKTEDRILLLLEWYGPLTDEDLLRIWAHVRTQGLGAYPGDWGGLSAQRLRTGRSVLVSQGKAAASAEKGRTSTGRSCQQWEAVG